MTSVDESVKNGLLETRYVGEIRCAQADVFPLIHQRKVQVTALRQGRPVRIS
jgi:hypothetical protein